MYRSLLHAITVILFLASAAPAAAEKQSAFAASYSATAFTNLWIDTCLTNAMAPSDVQKLLDTEKRFSKNPQYAKTILKDKYGTVWDASVGSRTQQAVTLYSYKHSGARCQAQVNNADTKHILEKFEALVPKMLASGANITRTVNSEIMDGVKYETVTFSLYRAGIKTYPYFSMSVSDSPSAPWQAIMVHGQVEVQKP